MLKKTTDTKIERSKTRLQVTLVFMLNRSTETFSFAITLELEDDRKEEKRLLH